MGLETGDFIDDLVDTNPLGTDPVSEGDDHLTLIKRAIVNAFQGDAATVSLLVNALAGLVANSAGIRVISTVPGNTQVRMENDVGDNVANVLVNAAGLLRILVSTVAESIELRGSAVAENDTTMASFDPLGEAMLSFAGVETFVTKVAGTLSNGRTFDWGDPVTDVNILARFLNVIGGLRLTVLSTTGTARLDQTDNLGAAEKTWIDMVRDGGITLSFNGAAMLSTLVDGIQIDQQTNWTTGSGSPEGVVAANPGSLYSDQVSGSGFPLWIKNFSNGTTGWLKVSSAAP